MAEKPSETSGKFELAPPHAAVTQELAAWGATSDDRLPPGLVRLPGSDGSVHWTEALARMRRQAQAFQKLSQFQQTPVWKSPTAVMLVGGFIALATVAVTVVQDPMVAEIIPAPWNKLLPPLITAIGVPKMWQWWKDYRREQEAELADQRRAFALGMVGVNTDPRLHLPPNQDG